MATTFTFFRPVVVRASAKPDPNNRKPVSANWWAPLFGWSTDPDYLNGPKQEGSDPERTRSRIRTGRLTEEKAKELRRKIAETSTWCITRRLRQDSPLMFPKGTTTNRKYYRSFCWVCVCDCVCVCLFSVTTSTFQCFLSYLLPNLLLSNWVSISVGVLLYVTKNDVIIFAYGYD